MLTCAGGDAAGYEGGAGGGAADDGNDCVADADVK